MSTLAIMPLRSSKRSTAFRKKIADDTPFHCGSPGGKNVLWSLKRGQPTPATFKALCAAAAPKEFDLHIRLNLGSASALMYAADLTEEYVEFNKGDVTDPATLGG